jgi:hypothetical protein
MTIRPDLFEDLLDEDFLEEDFFFFGIVALACCNLIEKRISESGDGYVPSVVLRWGQYPSSLD